MYPQPPLLIVVPKACHMDLANLRWCGAARGKVSVNPARFRDLEMVEVIVDAMPFVLTPLTPEETGRKLTARTCDLLFCDLPSASESAIGIAPGEHVAGAAQIEEVHSRLLMLGQWIGKSLEATAAAWMPARILGSFAWFEDAVSEYLVRGRFPSRFHVACREISPHQFTTTGLHYFTGQEIRIAIPPDYSEAEAEERIAEIIADIVSHGRIDRLSQSADPVRRETVIYTPGSNLEQVDILIRRDAP